MEAQDTQTGSQQPQAPNLPPTLLQALQELDTTYLSELRLNRREQGALGRTVGTIVQECERLYVQGQALQRQLAGSQQAEGVKLVEGVADAVFKEAPSAPGRPAR